MHWKVFCKGIYAVNRIYLPNHCSVELRALGIYFKLDGIIAGTISKEGCATLIFPQLPRPYQLKISRMYRVIALKKLMQNERYLELKRSFDISLYGMEFSNSSPRNWTCVCSVLQNYASYLTILARVFEKLFVTTIKTLLEILSETTLFSLLQTGINYLHHWDWYVPRWHILPCLSEVCMYTLAKNPGRSKDFSGGGLYFKEFLKNIIV